MASNKSHHNHRGFQNLYEQRNYRITEILRWFFEERLPYRFRSRADLIPQVKCQLPKDPDHAYVTWLGHATTLFQYKGINVITDPILSRYCTPVPPFGPKRYTKPGLSKRKLPPIHYGVISHNHYDHLDLPTMKFLGEKVTWMVPLGLKQWFQRRGILNVIEFDWWDAHRDKDTTFTCTPSQHWSKRRLFDSDRSLWSSWSIQIHDKKFWFAGDTGYNPHQFKEIGKQLGPFDVAAIPIGAYDPRWFMHPYHADPNDAVQIHRDVQSKWSFGIHWGTFPLSSEPIDEPPKMLAKALRNAKLSATSFEALAIGETRKIA